MKQSFTDMMGRIVDIAHPPERIVSVVPSQTELLYDLGLDEEVVGITKFCVHPQAWFREKTRVGGTKRLNIEKIHALRPDLIIANKEENTKEDIEQLAKDYPVWISDIQDMPRALDMIKHVGAITGKAERAGSLVAEIEAGFKKLHRSALPKRVAYFIWYQPWMSVGKDTFIHHVISRMGWVNVLGDMSRYPEVSMDVLKSYDPEIILLSSEPYPFKQKHVDEINMVLPGAKVLLVDGEMFSWYGSRMLKAVSYLQDLVGKVSHL